MMPLINSSFQPVREPVGEKIHKPSLEQARQQGISVVPKRMMPPPAMSCFMPWLLEPGLSDP